MQDILLEPYGGQILHLTVGATTALTALLAVRRTAGLRARGARRSAAAPIRYRMAAYGALVGLPAFAAVIFAAPLDSAVLFGIGTTLIGFGAGLFGHGTLTATMGLAPSEQTGLALGAWGAVQASAAGIAIALGGVIRDVVSSLAMQRRAGRGHGRSVDRLQLRLSPRNRFAVRHADRDRPARAFDDVACDRVGRPEFGLAEFPG